MALIRKLIQRIKDQKGVTLIELLAVIIILGIIAAIGIPAIVNSRSDAEEATRTTNAKLIEEAVKKHLLFGETYDADATGAAGDSTTFSIREIATELQISNLGAESGAGEVSVPVNNGQGDAVGTYTVNTTNGVTKYDKTK
jgi:type IV pilus assembly protein PilA